MEIDDSHSDSGRKCVAYQRVVRRETSNNHGGTRADCGQPRQNGAAGAATGQRTVRHSIVAVLNGQGALPLRQVRFHCPPREESSWMGIAATVV